MSERLSADVDHPVDSADVDHRALAVALFNHVWTLLELAGRTREQDDEMETIPSAIA